MGYMFTTNVSSDNLTEAPPLPAHCTWRRSRADGPQHWSNLISICSVCYCGPYVTYCIPVRWSAYWPTCLWICVAIVGYTQTGGPASRTSNRNTVGEDVDHWHTLEMIGVAHIPSAIKMTSNSGFKFYFRLNRVFIKTGETLWVFQVIKNLYTDAIEKIPQ